MTKQDLIEYKDWETTINEMKMLMEKLNIMAPPEESVKIIVAAIECVQAGIRAAMPGKNTGADELIPCTIYILSRGRILFFFFFADFFLFFRNFSFFLFFPFFFFVVD